VTTLLEQHAHALAEFDRRVVLVRPEQWSDPTPCTEWDVRTLVCHVTDAQRWVPHFLAGGSVKDAGDRFTGDPLGDDPVAAWRAASGAARRAFEADGALDRPVALPGGPTSARDYIWTTTVGLTVHAWDLARGIGADDRLDHELVRRVHAQAEKDVDALAASGRFAPPVRVSSSADLQSRMLALFGRRG
jgi:uncharacterized protein (TIGR03086 family)